MAVRMHQLGDKSQPRTARKSTGNDAMVLMKQRLSLITIGRVNNSGSD